MIFANAWWLVGLLGVAVAAAWALYRPGKRMAVVGSLRLWQEALQADSHTHKRRFRRLSASWLLLLAGCAAAVLALAGPTIVSHKPIRKVALAVCPSAELGAGGLAAMKKSAAGLLDRLDRDDLVAVIVPACQGASAGWLTPAAAGKRIDSLEILPALARSLTLGPADPSVQRTYYLGCGGVDLPAGPAAETILLPCDLPAVSIDAVGAAPLPDGKSQLFVALRKRQAGDWSGRAAVAWPDGQTEKQIDIPAGKDRHEIILDVPAGQWLSLQIAGQTACLARTETGRIKIALAGRDEPILRRFVKADSRLEAVADAGQADVVIVNSAAVPLPPGKPAILIDPPSPPPGWLRGDELSNLVLDQPRQAADDPLMKAVDFTGLSILKSQAWRAGDLAEGKPLLMAGPDALIARSDPQSQAGGRAEAKRIYVAFSLSGQNTNMAFSESMVIFLANAVGWLAGGSGGTPRYEYAAPLEASGWRDWQSVAGREPGDNTKAGPLPQPGIYKDAAGGIHAVSLVGLDGPAGKVDPDAAVANAQLPRPRPGDAIMNFQIWLAIAGCLLWLAGWLARLH
ncbi:MAG: BatA domain-containing protein [Planctomycetes bacterium]|nr:BatA domain-containing protein [Planctomycetota bacterium]